MMTKLNRRYLISDLRLIEKLIGEFTFVSSDDENWTTIFLDKTTDERWLSYYVDTAQHSGGYNILGCFPLPTTEELIDIAILSEREDEVFAACRTLVDNEEFRKQDFRLLLIDKVERLRDKPRREKVIELSGLTSPLNRREILGKTAEQIRADAYYYKQIADRADKLGSV